MTKFKTDFEFSKLKKPVIKPDWIFYSGFTTTVNAFYSSQDNYFSE